MNLSDEDLFDYLSSSRSDYEVVRVDEDRVFIVDLDLGGKSVTNDAEKVLEEIKFHFPGKRLIYKDTLGNWDEIKFDRLAQKQNGGDASVPFCVEFAPYREEVPDFIATGYPSSELLRKN